MRRECCGAAEEAITNNSEATNWSWELKVLTSLEGVKEPPSEGKAASRGDSRLAAPHADGAAADTRRCLFIYLSSPLGEPPPPCHLPRSRGRRSGLSRCTGDAT